MGVKYLGDYSTDGTCLGRAAADKIGFHGTTPIAQQSGAGQAAVTVSTITTAATTTTPWGFATSTQADNLAASVALCVTLVNQLRSDLVDLGLIAGA